MDRGQLAGKRIVVTRRLEQADALCDQLIARGAVPILFPTIQLASLPTPNLDAILPTISQYDWLLFTSVNAVTFFFERVRSLQITPQLPSIGVSGKATANRLRQYHYEPEFMPTKFVGEALVEGLADFVAKECHSSLSGQQVLLPRAKAGRPIVVELLRQQGAIVHEFALYNTVPARPTSSALAALQQGIDVITFASPSSIHNFLGIMAEHQLERVILDRAIVACIGPVTAKTLEVEGLTAHIVPDEYTIHGLVGALVQWFARS